MKGERNAQVYQVGPYLFGTSSTIPRWKTEELIPSLKPFLLSLDTYKEKELKIAFSLAVQPESEIQEEDHAKYRSLVEFEWEGATCRISVIPDTDSYLITILAPNDPKEYTAYFFYGFTKGVLFLHETEADAFVLNNILMMIYAFNTACSDTVLMHASVIKKDGKGYLFQGKSGTGKSTHSGLWLKHIPGCELLNDDNPIVHFNRKTGEATVYGSPWSGKTPCYRQVKAPLGAITQIDRAPANSVDRLSPLQALAILLPSCSSMKWDERLHGQVCDTMSEVIGLTPIYMLHCLPNEEAARVCCRAIAKE